MCYLTPCAEPGIWQPILNLKSRSNGSVTTLHFTKIRVCDKHKTASTVDSFLSDEGFDKLARHMRDAGKSVPQHRLTTLSWKKDPIKDDAAPPTESSTVASAGEALPS